MSIRICIVLLAWALPAVAIPPEDAARIKYSTGQFVCLDVGEEHVFKLKDGRQRRVKLKSVTERSDRVMDLLRGADVVVEIDGRPLELLCEPYVMPTELNGLRILADTTNRYMDLPKRVQLSLGDATDPIVNTDLFVFPLAGYRLFSQGTQCYNEPVHLGDRDGDPEGQRFYHNYGFDLAGYEGRDEVLACVDGTLIRVLPDEGTLVIEDDRGIVFEYGHMDRFLPEIKEGKPVKRGQKLGVVGRKGASGNFSHLHVGMYLSKADLDNAHHCREMNLYPWMVAAFGKAAGQTLLAVARPHHAIRTGEAVRLDGTRSVAFGSKIKSYRWEFHDGTSVHTARAEKSYDRPGTYMAALWVENEQGARDVDFCKVKVYSKEKVEPVMPTLFMTYSPSLGVRAGRPVYFRGWPQGAAMEAIRLDYGDGTVIENYVPYAEVSHVFAKPGVHVVTATARAGGIEVSQKLKVIVEK